ncbi:MAG: PAS domain-containing sensor histidine kinase [Pseudomonadota bacterium]
MDRSVLEQAERFRHIAEISGDVAWIVECPGGTLSYVSPAIETITGYNVAQFEAQFGAPREGEARIAALAALCGGLDERLRRYAEGDLTRRKLVREFDLQHCDGHTVPVETVSALHLDGRGVPTALVGVIRDTSARREREEDLEREQKRFASMLNHEFRTPLSTIDGAIQRLEATGVNADEPTRLRYRKIQTAVDRLIEMLDEYLSPERMAAIGKRRQPTSVAPLALLEEGAELARGAGRTASVDGQDLPPSLRCDPAGLRLALKVLVENAVNYSPAKSPIALAGRSTEGGIELVVQDAGPGVAMAEQERIFDKFFRGSTAGTVPGSGLGLYMARSVLEVHGGSVTMRNRHNGGAEFCIWLPSHAAQGKTVA